MVEEIARLIRQCYESLDGIKPMECSCPWIEREGLWIKNEMFTADGLRKIHLETSEVRGLDVLHCVFFPDPTYNIPVFGADIVATKTVITAAIVDISPIFGSDHVHKETQKVADKFIFNEPRKVPEWGDIFSPQIKFQRIRTAEETVKFAEVVLQYLIIYKRAVGQARFPSPLLAAQRRADQIHYSTQQRKNKKTIAALSSWFDRDWALDYIDNILFDLPK